MAPPRWRLSIISEQDATIARSAARLVARFTPRRGPLPAGFLLVICLEVTWHDPC